jgi:hypothetical protein
MIVMDGNDLPIRIHEDSAQHHEIWLVEKTFSTIGIPQKLGHPWKPPKELIADKAYYSDGRRRKCGNAESSRPFSKGRNRENQNGGVQSKQIPT